MYVASSVSTYSETTYVTVTYLSKNTNCIAREEQHGNASNFLSLFPGCSATVDLFLLFLVGKWVCLFYFLHFGKIFVFLIHFPFFFNAPKSRNFALCMLLNVVPFSGLTVKHVLEWPSIFSLVNIQVMRNWSSIPLRNMTLSPFSQCTDFGRLEVACWLLVPKFAGSNPAETVRFLRAKKSSARLPTEGK
jgi:hypothetical protein